MHHYCGSIVAPALHSQQQINPIWCKLWFVTRKIIVPRGPGISQLAIKLRQIRGSQDTPKNRLPAWHTSCKSSDKKVIRFFHQCRRDHNEFAKRRHRCGYFFVVVCQLFYHKLGGGGWFTDLGITQHHHLRGAEYPISRKSV